MHSEVKQGLVDVVLNAKKEVVRCSERTRFSFGQDCRAASAEVRVAKVALTNVCLWMISWSPYAAVVIVCQFVEKDYVTPLTSTIPSLMCKVASCLNPLVYAVSHPK